MLHAHGAGLRGLFVAPLIAIGLASTSVAFDGAFLGTCTPGVDSPNCCSQKYAGACPGGCGVGPRLSRRKNMILFVSDDNGYCHFGFMQGMCSESSLTQPCNYPCPGSTATDCCPAGEWCARNTCIKPCLSNGGCDERGLAIGGVPAGICMSSAELGVLRNKTGLPLRIADLSCRNRWPVHGPFPFNRELYPPDPTGGQRQQAQDFDGHAITPHLDALAAEAVVFPRAHVGAMRCTPSRSVLWSGMSNRHLDTWEFDATGTLRCPLKIPNDNPPMNQNLVFSGVGCYLHNLNSGTGPSRFHTYLWGKEDIVQAYGAETPDGDFDRSTMSGNSGVGNANDDCGDDCAATLRKGKIPYNGDTLPFVQIDNILNAVVQDQNLDIHPGNGMPDNVTTKPFFLWYSPNVPHFGAAAPAAFHTPVSWYPGFDYTTYAGVLDDKDNLQQLFERISAFDAGVGALIDGLQRRCVCDADAQPRSLFDNTIVFMINDNGNILPDAKRQPTENGERSPIIISEPGHRGVGAALAPAVKDDLASGIDLMATMVSYAQQTHGPTGTCGPLAVPNRGPTDDAFEFHYPYYRNLCHSVRGLSSRVREVYPAHLADDAMESTDLIRMITTAPGKLGVCNGGPLTAQGHVRVCQTSEQCVCQTPEQCAPGTCVLGRGVCPGTSPPTPCVRDSDCLPGPGPCAAPVVGAKGGRCTNDPGKACALDRDCADDNWCQQSVCVPGAVCNPLPPSPSSEACVSTGKACNIPVPFPVSAPGTVFPEFQCRPCNHGGDCVPRGVCAEPVVKLLNDDPPNAGVPAKLFDPNWDPDQTAAAELLAGDPGYLDTGMRDDLQVCLDGFWDLTPNGTPETRTSWIQPLQCPFDP